MKTFLEYLQEQEQGSAPPNPEKTDSEEKPSHSGMYKTVLNVDRSAMIGMPLTLNGPVGNKAYNMLPTIVSKFLPDEENPTQVELKIDTSDNPHLAQQVIWRDKEEPTEAPADTGSIVISIDEFDQILGTPWQSVAQQAMGGGMGGMGGIGGM